MRLASLAIVLLATVVAGSEDRRRETRMAETRPVEARVPGAPAQPPADEELDVSLLQRPKRAEPVIDVFTPKVIPAPEAVPPGAAKAEPPAPLAPPAPPALPFRYVGKFVEKGAVRLLIAKGETDYDVSGGETLDGMYRVDEVSEQAVVFTYLPLELRQILSIPPANEASR